MHGFPFFWGGLGIDLLPSLVVLLVVVVSMGVISVYIMAQVYFIPAFFLLLFFILVAAAVGPQVVIALVVEVNFVDISLLVKVMVAWGAGEELGFGAICVDAVMG